MDEDSKVQGFVKWGLGALGLGAIVSAVTIPHIGIWVALVIIALALLLFGGYYLWQRQRARRQREMFTSAIEEQTAAAPRTISDPKKRADLDKVRGKFQTGLQEFKSRGKDIYQLPWYVIIGESGSGKSEAIRHSEIDFPPGLNKEHQGTGGTVNMDWWFSNRGVILDTAGSMLFPEAGAGDAPEWKEFLRLLKKARPHCPINGLFLVLSIESLIKDSADKISQKASRLAQHLDLIQRTLDVRFPVYLLVTKCDLLTGFREFFDSIEDPLLQHQIFGWSNPDPLDAPFRPDLVEQHLGSVAERVSRRRMALLRESSAAGRLGDTQHFFASSYQLGKGPAGARRLDEVDSMFALPESLMRLAPRLRRYLETIFVAGEWSAKPVFLRGIYFTSSMREGKALDEAIAFATGVPLDQLPEDRTWDKNRAFFLRDLFHEKVFRESGLVTRATNTLKLLRQRQLAIFGTAGVALVLLLVFAGFSYHNLKQSVLKEADYWQAGATNWDRGEWSPIVRAGAPPNALHFAYAGTNLVDAGSTKPTIVEYHQGLKRIVEKPLAVGFIFKPLAWVGIGKVEDRPKAQRLLLEGSVLRPLVLRARGKMMDMNTPLKDTAAHREALLSLMQLEADRLATGPTSGFISDSATAQKNLTSFLAYLTDGDVAKPDTNLVDVFAWTYSKDSLKHNAGKWPPDNLSGGNTLAANLPIKIGLERFNSASIAAQTNLDQQATLANAFTDSLKDYHQKELTWLAGSGDSCAAFASTLQPAKTAVDASWSQVRLATNLPVSIGPLTNLASRYSGLQAAASNASIAALAAPVTRIILRLPDREQTTGLFKDIQDKLGKLASEAAGTVRAGYEGRKDSVALLDTNCMVRTAGADAPAYELRWNLYTGACAIASAPNQASDTDIGNEWKHFGDLKALADHFRASLAGYKGPLGDSVSNACNRIASDGELRLKEGFIESYVKLVTGKLSSLPQQYPWTIDTITNARVLFASVKRDLDGTGLGPEEKKKLASLPTKLADSKKNVLAAIDADVHGKLGFPVLLPASGTMRAPKLIESKKLFDQLDAELSNPVWADFPDGPKTVEALKSKIESYRSVVRALVVEGKGGDSVAHFKLFFVPNEMKDGSDYDFIKVYRWLTVSFGLQSLDQKEITAPPDKLIELGEGPVDLGLNFAFRNNVQGGTTIEKTVKDWALARFIHDGDAKSDNGKIWRIRFKPQDSQPEKVVFEVQLDNPLPRIDEWPK